MIKLNSTDGGRFYEGFHDETKDCTVRALALVGDMTYGKAHAALKTAGRRDRKGVKLFTIRAAANLAGIGFESIIPSGYGYPILADVIRMFKSGRYYLVSRNHAMALIDGVIHDNGQVCGPRSRIKFVFKVTIPEKPVMPQVQVNELWDRLNRLEQRFA
jgi:hypothetical protein